MRTWGGYNPYSLLNLGLFEDTEVLHCCSFYKAVIRNFRMAHE